ncbi:MAG: sulfatase-like hydrolase/transferase, partial [Cyclobacteriaceae bacterium]|nr:sulfatase-like hydrolase/transferase [Cyclobacteriaceae bacterium]
ANAPTSPYTEDGKPTHWKEGSYSTDFYTDKMIEYIGKHKDDNKPFFGFAAYTSPHWPLQVDDKYWRKYEGRYDAGYEKLKEERLKSLIQAGIIPQNVQLPPNHVMVKPWETLSDQEKKIESRKMELYAGMVDNLDYNVGRIINYLKDIGEYDNTLIVFMSDNGAAAEDFYYDDFYGPFLREHFNDDFENMGQPNSFIAYGPQWAEAGSSPFRYFKGFTTEGGMVAPMVISGPGVDKHNQISHEFVTLMDLAPTFYELADATYPETFNNQPVYPLKGNSMVPFLQGKKEEIHSSDYVFGMEHSEYAMIRKGDWKITNITKPFVLDSFKLFHISEDLAELNDLKVDEPDKYKELLEEWEQFRKAIKVQFPVPKTSGK